MKLSNYYLAFLIWCIVAVDSSAYQGSSKKRTQERGLYWDFEPYSNVDPNEVKEIHLVFSNHMDVGFNSRAWLVKPIDVPKNIKSISNCE